MLIVADWVVPVGARPIRRGAVLVSGGRIEAVGPAASLCGRYGTDRTLNLGRCALLPGFVNAHTHLELSALLGFARPCGFPEWMLRLLLARRKLVPEDLAVSAVWGAWQCVQGGVTCVADASFEGWTTTRALHTIGLRGRVYVEVFEVDEGEALKALAGTGRRMARAAQEAGALVEVGLSPHAPYTVSEKLYRQAARYARRRNLWIATHVAESPAEVELLLRGRGGMAGAYRVAGLWKGNRWAPPGARPAAYVAAAGGLGPRVLAIHCVQMDARDVACLAASGSAVAHCPRSNARLQCGVAPVREFLEAGLRVGLGTDSLASNETLDMFDEMRSAVAAAEERAKGEGRAESIASGMTGVKGEAADGEVLDARAVLRMATLGGAQALGLGEEIGTIEVGKRADLMAVRVPRELGEVGSEGEERPKGGSEGEEVVRRLVRLGSAADVRMTMVNGCVVFDREGNDGVGDHLYGAFDAVRDKLGLPALGGGRLR